MDQKYASTGELKALREELGLSQDKCQELIGKGRNWWYWHEKGTIRTPRHVLDDLRQAFNRLSETQQIALTRTSADPLEMKAFREKVGLTPIECSRMLSLPNRTWHAAESGRIKVPVGIVEALKSAYDSLPDTMKEELEGRATPIATVEEVVSLRNRLGLKSSDCSLLLGKPQAWWSNREGGAKMPSYYLESLQAAFDRLSENEKHSLQQWRVEKSPIVSLDAIKATRKHLGLSGHECSRLMGKGKSWWTALENKHLKARQSFIDDLIAAYDALSDEKKKALVTRQLIRAANKRGFDLRKVYAELNLAA